MKLRILPHALSVCQVGSVKDVDPDAPFYFIGKTEEEMSLVCRTEDCPENTVSREDGWRGFFVDGVLDFSLTGILAKLAETLAQAGVPIFAVSTWNTDYILVKAEQFGKAVDALTEAGYTFV